VKVLLLQGTSAGGVGRHVAALAGGLVRAGHEVVVGAPPEAAADFDLGSTGAAFAAVDIRDRPRLQDRQVLARLRGLAAGADVVHAHGLRAGALAGLASGGRRGRTPLVVTLHNLPVGGLLVRRTSALLERTVARRADAVLGVSGDLVVRMRERGARRTARALVPSPPGAAPSGSREEVRRRVRDALGLAPHQLLVVTVARLAPQKGYPLWFDAIGLLARSHAGDVVVAVAGDGPLRPELERRVADEGLPVQLLGARSDAADLFTAADVAVCPSVWEGQPLVVQEALRLGAPLVATDVGGTGEVTGDAAVLVPYGDPQALATAVGRLLDDPAGREHYRRAGLERARGLPTDDDAVEQVLQVYREVVGT
jgi:glycosyltransferase involved in cell wall biosynthesis